MGVSLWAYAQRNAHKDRPEKLKLMKITFYVKKRLKDFMNTRLKEIFVK
ncbi:MAG: hypothetical protein NZ455_10170 [Bacteroidia bacterium]|nr:hypothetical protein [Bacteroidia bacterium]MDW8346167.1 hypothetical protein [Bacteroidia bacterium]